VLLARADRTLIPNLGFVWKVGIAAGLAALVFALPLPSAAELVLSTIVYAVTILLTGALPAEVFDAFVRRRTALDP
jgi:hypothetical protein